MSTATAECTDSIGHVVQISGQVVQVLFEHGSVEDQSVSRLGSYVVIPVDDRRVVGLIISARASDPADQSSSQILIEVQLLGQIRDGRFARGVDRFPSICGAVQRIGSADLDVVFGKDAGQDAANRFALGKFAANDRYMVYLTGKHFFSKHAAILGNSGSGKSCTVTRIISESIKYQGSQVVLFDLHGEYRRAFSDETGQVLPNVTYMDEKDLVLPYWLLHYEELAAIFVDQSSPQLISNQRSLLREALLKLKTPAAKKLGLEHIYNVDTPVYFPLDQLRMYAQNMNEARFIVNSGRYAFARTAARNMTPEEQEDMILTQRVQFNQGQAQGEIPHPFYYQKLNGFVDLIDHKLNDRRYDFMLRPIEQAGRSEVFKQFMPPAKQDDDQALADWSNALGWLVKVFTGQFEPRRNLAIVDLSAIPFEIVDLTVGLLTRLIFDFNFYSQSETRQPVVLVFEEAHNYVPRENHRQSFARLAVERVAKEGRKYGVSAIIVSQRPSELSHTVLSQCNNMIVMRLNNPEDQSYVTKVVSDQFADLVKMLPTLKPGEGFVIGDSVAMPMRTLIQLPDTQPNSENIDFFDRWSQQHKSEDLQETMQHWWHQHRP